MTSKEANFYKVEDGYGELHLSDGSVYDVYGDCDQQLKHEATHLAALYDNGCVIVWDFEGVEP